MSRHAAPEPVPPDFHLEPVEWAAWAATVVLENLDRWERNQDAETLVIPAVQA